MDGYNGWQNWETWVTNLRLDQDGVLQMVRETVDSMRDDDDGAEEMTDRAVAMLKEWIDEAMPETTGLFADLLTGAIQRVDFREIAVNLLED